MELFKSLAGVAFVAFYLLPGLLGTVVYDYLVEGEKRDNFERILQAFVLTLLNALLVHEMLGTPLIPDIDMTGEAQVSKIASALLDKNLVILSLSASVIGLVFAVINNHGLLYAVLRKLRITHKMSAVDVWQDVLNRNPRCWVRVSFSDDSYLVGWPRYYSATGKPREIFVAEATWWRVDTDGGFQSTDVTGAGVYISDFSKVTSIELLQGTEEASHG